MPNLNDLRSRIRAQTLTPETPLVKDLAEMAALSSADRQAISEDAATLVKAVRDTGKIGIMESFLAEYGLSTKEGVALMCLAEAMLRVPDSYTVDELIRDKITPHDWGSHVGDSGSILVNASTWGLMLTGRVLEDDDEHGIAGTLHGMVRRLGEPVIRRAVRQAMAEMGQQFVLGRTINEAMKRGDGMVEKGYTYSYDMLGEAARTDKDALKYQDAYARAIKSIASRATFDNVRQNPGISVKLSALHSRYEVSQREKMLPVLTDRLLTLARAAKDAGIGFNIDAEEADRLDISLDVIEATLGDPSLKGWDGFGIVVQAFGRRAMPTLDYLHGLAEHLDRKIMVRLVKGAYWDMEVKRAQVMGLKDYPVFTRKVHTDISYLAGARKLLGMTDRIYPQFATHNAHSVAAVLRMVGNDREHFEFQRLHGMGEQLHEAVRKQSGANCRIYAPVGAHSDLLAYLVRRLLENGANSSFVNQIVDLDVSPQEIATDPIQAAAKTDFTPSPAIPKPAEIFAPRENSKGWDLTDHNDLSEIEDGREPFKAPHQWSAEPITPSDAKRGSTLDVLNPASPGDVVGKVTEATPELADDAVSIAAKAQPGWEAMQPKERAEILRAVADAYEANTHEILAIVAREAGKTQLDGVAEIREAVDFLRFYADEAERHGTKGRARGVIICISPWNFPLAIFTGQIAAALAAGNAVVAKPAEQTPLIAAFAVKLMREVGIPEGVIQLLPGDGAAVGGPLTANPAINGVCFTGSTEVAKLIDRQLAKTAPEAMLIAETGGLNAMIVDSTALLEQATRDILRASFQSAGQRCSALRVLYVQKDVEKELIEMVSGAMDELQIGDPWHLKTDTGPVIDDDAFTSITAHIDAAEQNGTLIKRLDAPGGGRFVPPAMIRVKGIEDIEQEIFGPVLHVASFKGEDIGKVLSAINAKGYGLTFGLHSRIDRRVQSVLDGIHVGNAYVNRDQIGAIVGSQPFGGHGLSGTGPKAGGPLYFAQFRTSDAKPLASVEGAAVKAEEISKTLRESPTWAHQKNRVEMLRSALRGKGGDAIAASAALDFGPIDLPGPTGESNQYALQSRGRVLCLGPDGDSLRAQVLQALAAGNTVVAVAPDASRSLKQLVGQAFPLTAVDGQLDFESVNALAVNLVAYAGPKETLASLRQALSKGDGPIVPIVRDVISPASYCNETTVCIDTTAAGGNATLLSEVAA